MNIIVIVFKNRKNSKIRKELYFYEYHFKIEKIVKLEKIKKERIIEIILFK